jgi:hypothetical protein
MIYYKSNGELKMHINFNITHKDMNIMFRITIFTGGYISFVPSWSPLTPPTSLGVEAAHVAVSAAQQSVSPDSLASLSAWNS